MILVPNHQNNTVYLVTVYFEKLYKFANPKLLQKREKNC
jgi:hypothetical protein